MRNILDILSECVLVVDKDTRVVLANSAMLEASGLGEKEITGRKCTEVSDVCRQAADKEGRCPHLEALETGETVKRTVETVSLEGWRRTISVMASPLSEENGEAAQALCIMRDQTESAKSEKILKRYAEGLAILYELSTIFLNTKELGKAIENSLRMIGAYYEAEFTQVLFPDEDGGSLKHIAGTGWKEGSVEDAVFPASKEEQVGHTFFETCPVIVNDYGNDKRFKRPPLYEEHGIMGSISVPMVADERTIGVLCLLYVTPQDIDTAELWYLNVVANSLAVYIEKERSIEKVEKSEAFLSSVLEGIGEGVVVVGRDYRIISANNSYLGLMNVPQEEAIGRYCYEVSHNIEKPCYENGETCTVKRVFETGVHHSALHTHYDSTGKAIFVETNAYPIKKPSGEVLAAVETITDVTERTKLKKDLEKRVKELEDFYEMAVGRELRMIELKEEIEELQEELRKCRASG